MSSIIRTILTGTITYYVCKQLNQKNDAVNIAANIAVASVVAAAIHKINK